MGVGEVIASGKLNWSPHISERFDFQLAPEDMETLDGLKKNIGYDEDTL